jgi:TonB family protein
MNHWTRLIVASSFFWVFAFLASNAQTPDAPKKNCTPPIVKHREDERPPKSSRTELFAAVNVLINEQGRVADASLRNSSGNDEFDDNVLDAIKHWTFKPSLCDGQPSSTQVTIQFKFSRH